MIFKDFNKVIFSETFDPNNEGGSFAEATETSFVTETAYVFNPVTDLVVEQSKFFYTYWPSYSGVNWIELSAPSAVIQHTQNHFRAVAVSILQRQGLTFYNLWKIANITLGFPFTLVSGIVSVIDKGDSWHIHQYPFQTTIAGETSFVYTVGKNFSLNFRDGDIVDSYEPIWDGAVFCRDYFSTFIDYFEAFDRYSKIPLEEIQNIEIDRELNIKRIVSIQRTRTAGYNYNFTYFFNVMKRLFPKDLLLYYKEIV